MFSSYFVPRRTHKFIVEKCIVPSCRGYAAEAKFTVQPYKLHMLDKGPSREVTISKDLALDMLRKMLVCRRMEDSCATLYKATLIRGFCHLYAGEEACCVGLHSCMSDKDTCITSYRCHAWTYVMGQSVHSIIAELVGKVTGCSRGKGGSMHIYAKNFYGGNGIVAGHIPLGTGIAFRHKYLGEKAVSLVCYGDGAANQGQTFESYNLAKLHDLPVIYICENNRYALGTSVKRHSANTSYYNRCEYIPGFWVDGMDVLAMRAAGLFAKKHVADGKGPIIMEAATYRYYGHSVADPGTTYRTREEVHDVREKHDPINTFKKKILTAKLVTEDEVAKIDKETKQEVKEATERAKADKDPDDSELVADTYSLNLEGKIRSTVLFNPREHRTLGNAINMN